MFGLGRPNHYTMTVQIVWFKRDLRVYDHAPLIYAQQQGDVLPSVVANSGFGTFVPMTPALGGIPVLSTIQNGTNGVLNKAIDINKDFGGLRSTGYVHIGQDPDSQDSFNVEDEEGQRDFTTVKLIRDDIEDLL